MGLLALIPLRTWFIGLGAASAVACCAWAILAIRADGFDACEREHQLVAAAQAEAAHQEYLAAVEKGEELSAELLKTQRRLDDTKREYMAYANGIAGNCPASIGMLSNAAATGTSLPEATSELADPTATISAAALGANLAENFTRCRLNAEQLAALIAWHNRPKETVK